MKRIAVTTRIDAPTERVWEILTDFGRYAEWNPGILKAEGALGEAHTVRIAMILPSGKINPMVVTLTGLQSGRELGWTGELGAQWLLSGHRRFVLEADSGGTRFEHSEVFKGVLSLLLIGPAQAKIRQGFEAINQALKSRAEQLRPAQ